MRFSLLLVSLFVTVRNANAEAHFQPSYLTGILGIKNPSTECREALETVKHTRESLKFLDDLSKADFKKTCELFEKKPVPDLSFLDQISKPCASPGFDVENFITAPCERDSKGSEGKLCLIEYSDWEDRVSHESSDDVFKSYLSEACKHPCKNYLVGYAMEQVVLKKGETTLKSNALCSDLEWKYVKGENPKKDESAPDGGEGVTDAGGASNKDYSHLQAEIPPRVLSAQQVTKDARFSALWKKIMNEDENPDKNLSFSEELRNTQSRKKGGDPESPKHHASSEEKKKEEEKTGRKPRNRNGSEQGSGSESTKHYRSNPQESDGSKRHDKDDTDPNKSTFTANPVFSNIQNTKNSVNDEVTKTNSISPPEEEPPVILPPVPEDFSGASDPPVLEDEESSSSSFIEGNRYYATAITAGVVTMAMKSLFV